MSVNFPGVAIAASRGFVACAVPRTSTAVANQAPTQTLIRRIEKHCTIASVMNLPGTFGDFPMRKTRAGSTNGMYTEDLDLEDTLEQHVAPSRLRRFPERRVTWRN